MTKPELMLDRLTVVRGDRIAGDVVVSGIVHVIRDEAEVDKFREGEILVAEQIPEDWTHLFCLAKAIVTGVIDVPEHVADAASELDLPVIVGVADVSWQLRSGDLVTMHTDGTIQRMPERRAPDSSMRVSVPAAVHARQFARQAAESALDDNGASVVSLHPAAEADQDQGAEQPVNTEKTAERK